MLQSFLHGLSARDDGGLQTAALGVLLVAPLVGLWLYSRSSSKPPAGASAKVHRPPGTLPFLGNTWHMLTKATTFHDWVYEICRRHAGEPVLVTALGRPDFYFLTTTAAFEECFKTYFDNFPKGAFHCENLAGLLGAGVFAVDHAAWLRQRKTASALFTARSLRESMAVTVRKHTETLVEMFARAQTSGGSVDLFKLFNRFTIEAFAEIGFGIEMNCLDAKQEHPFQTAFDRAQRAIILRFVRPLWFWKLQRALGVGSEGQLQQDIKVIDDTVYAIIHDVLANRASAEASTEEKTNLVSLFLNSSDADKDCGVDARRLRDIVVNFLIAGRDTTAQTLSWFFVCLSKHPEVTRKIRDEIRHGLPGLMDGSEATPSMEQVQQLTYLEATLKETLRLYPSVSLNTKHVENDIVLSDGTFLPRGSNVALPSYAYGRMHHVWGDDATAFRPERFIDEHTGKLLSFAPSKFIAFNAGPRICLGMNLAMMEMKIVAATLLSRFHIELLPDQHITYDFSLTLPVRGELLARVR